MYKPYRVCTFTQLEADIFCILGIFWKMLLYDGIRLQW